MNIVFWIGGIGGLASIIGLIMQVSDSKSRLRHGVLILLTVSFAVTAAYSWGALHELRGVEQAAGRLADEIRVVYRDSGDCRGTILSCLTFLETHKQRWPDTYAAARELATNLGVTEARADDAVDRIGQKFELCEAADAITAFLRGVAAGAAS